MPTLSIDVEDKYAHRFDGWFEVAAELEALGWRLGRNISGADFEMVQSQRVLERYGKSPIPRPIIIYERSGSGSIHPPRLRGFIKNPMVLGYAKETGFRDKSLYNTPYVQDRLHHNFISNADPVPHDMILSDADLDKVETIFQVYAHQDRYKNIRFRQTPKFRHRPADVFFSGTVKYDVDLITQHRIRCCDAISQLSGLNVLLGIGRSLGPTSYASAIADTKILVSPYGYGEYSWKDFEAIYNGCIVVKPESTFVETHGFDIYKENTYTITCRPDFSDLPEIIDGVLSDLTKWGAFAWDARVALEAAAREREQRARDIASFLQRCADRAPGGVN